MTDSNSSQSITPCSKSDEEGYHQLEMLALDMNWSGNQLANKIWKQLDPVLWESTHNPWIVLQTVSRETIKKLLADSSFYQLVQDIYQIKQVQEESTTWFKEKHPSTSLSCIVYFSMEYMLSEALPIYSGGLGNVAGDQLKSASDLGVPVVAIGLLYQQGYFRQVIDKEGNQEALYPYNDPGQLPITPLRKANGEWLRIEISFPGWSIWIRIWQVKVGRVHLYLLDTNDMANFPAYRAITSELYGGGSELRLKQEILLGIGGWRLVELLDLKPEVCHLNEGHAAFAVLERARFKMEELNISFEEALTLTRAGNLFTTHTAVSAGFDRFAPELIEQYLNNYRSLLGLSLQSLLALGRKDPNDANEPFNMAYLAIRGSGAINGVSCLHGEVSRNLFENLFPRWPKKEIPVGFVTNGIHVPSWGSEFSNSLWKKMCGNDCWKWALDFVEKDIEKISDLEIWDMRNQSRQSLVYYTRKRLGKQLAARGASEEKIEKSHHFFDDGILTLGFARRFATYKRTNLLLYDTERLLRILTHPKYPVQLLLAGKAHPADQPGQALIREWMQFIQRPEVRPHVAFLTDYDMDVTEHLVQGVDVWINTPRRPWEACGTSGMKVLVNGGLNASELDGWWVEAYTPEVGWAIGDGKEHADPSAWDAQEAEELYRILEEEIIPTFYQRNEEGIPEKWIQKIRASMAKLTPYYSANRAVRQYTEEYYLPAATNYKKRLEHHKLFLSQIIDWKQNLIQNWSKLRFGEIAVENHENNNRLEVQVYLDGIDPNDVKVQIYSINSQGQSEIQDMQKIRQLSGESHLYVYSAFVSNQRNIYDYTARIIPYFPDISVPLELNLILWQK